MTEIVTKKEQVKKLSEVLSNSLKNVVSEKRLEQLTKEKRESLSNLLLDKGTFTDFRIAGENDFAHFRVITSDSYEVSLSALTKMLYLGEPENITFSEYQNDDINHWLNGAPMLKGTEQVSPTIERFFVSVRAKNDIQRVIALMNCEYKSKMITGYEFFVNTTTDGNNNTIVDDTRTTEELNEITNKLEVVNIKKVPQITSITKKDTVFDITKTTFFSELSDEEQEELLENLKED